MNLLRVAAPRNFNVASALGSNLFPAKLGKVFWSKQRLQGCEHEASHTHPTENCALLLTQKGKRRVLTLRLGTSSPLVMLPESDITSGRPHLGKFFGSTLVP